MVVTYTFYLIIIIEFTFFGFLLYLFNSSEYKREMMKKLYLLIVLVLLSIVQLNAQVPVATPTSKLIFDQSGGSLSEITAYVYKYYPDGNTVGLPLTGVCTGTISPFTCSTVFPTFSNGNHSLTLTSTNAAGESVKSVPFAFVYGGVPLSPVNIRIG